MNKSLKGLLLILPLLLLSSGIFFYVDDLYEKFSIKAVIPAPHIKLSKVEAQESDSHQKDNQQPKSVIKAIKVTSTKPAYTVDGFDWSLPKNTPIENNSGLIDEYDRGIDYIRNVFAIVRWDEANPKNGRYDFSKFEKYLANAAPNKTLVRLEVNSACEAPKWALRKLRASKDKSLIFWDKSYIDLLKPFINAFAKRYANDPRVIGVYLGIADGEYDDNCEFDNKNGWGEFWMSPQSIANAQKKFGFNPEVFEKQTKAIVDVYVAAFGNNKHKLAFTNIAPSFSWNSIGEPYNEKLKKIAKHVWKTGIGNRDGHVEIWMRFIDKTYGVQLSSMKDGSCFLDFDEHYAKQIQGRYWGTENEFYGDKSYVKNANGPYKNQPYRFMVSSLRALQMRRNYFSVAGNSMEKLDHSVYKTQDFLRYLTKVMGKQMENTPDAFILLGERYISQDHAKNFSNEACVKNSKKGVAIRSFGRWLMEGSRSVPALRVSMPKNENYWGQNYYMPEGMDYEYSARKAKQFEFDLNDDLSMLRCDNGCKAEIKVTFKDTHKSTMNILYDKEFSQSFKTKGDNKIKTVTFNVNSRFQNELRGKDFMINSKTIDLTLIMIRVNFL
ncbi:MAG: hypothetical protein L3J51_00565 [Cocleimonas sp.]|nr:hypothetical protein [Cocleimonas sp.]